MKETKIHKVFPTKKKSFYFQLHIHPSQKSLRAYWDILNKDYIPHSSRTVKAFFLSYEISCGKCIGEIHLTKSLPPDIIAHECLHALIHWGKLKNLNIYHAEEQFCWVYQIILKSVLKFLGRADNF
ncbi:hypothetical protein UFOVP434_78 [uncultured Caudovirales phage]|uniref:Uncharacterized protein n=1 Tax=uncultured Caudovirales phage TaxID=2100421 RepID=A0A6J5M7R4_9CAUD|nr:hypothetical protein UFOVP434_78 [uncultured Caudovirales phage]